MVATAYAYSRGSGYSRCGIWRNTMARGRVCDDWGSYIYLRDVENDRVWSASLQPSAPNQTTTRLDSVRIALPSRGKTANWHTTLDVVVSAEDDAEVRRVTISNSGSRAGSLSHLYAEVAIAPRLPIPPIRHFPSCLCKPNILRSRRHLGYTPRRSPSEPEVWRAPFGG